MTMDCGCTPTLTHAPERIKSYQAILRDAPPDATNLRTMAREALKDEQAGLKRLVTFHPRYCR